MANDNGKWVTISGRRVFIRTNQHPIDAFIKQSKPKKLTKKDVVKDEYIGGDGYYNIELKDGYKSPDGLDYIWYKSKRGAYEILDTMIKGENEILERKMKNGKNI